MNRAQMYETYVPAMIFLSDHEDDRSSPAFAKALATVHTLAGEGCAEAVATLAEFYNRRGPTRDPEAAYKWYYISATAEGFQTRYENRNPASRPYMGPTGDFRNECLAGDLVSELGESRVRELDAEAAKWISTHRLFFTDPRDERSRL